MLEHRHEEVPLEIFARMFLNLKKKFPVWIYKNSGWYAL
jgi:hypothetical protein